jgi:hypothetical protein
MRQPSFPFRLGLVDRVQVMVFPTISGDPTKTRRWCPMLPAGSGTEGLRLLAREPCTDLLDDRLDRG